MSSDSEEEENDFQPGTDRALSRFVERSSDSSSEVEEEETDFDTDLPTTHNYLGKLNDVKGFTLLDHGEKLTLLAIHTNTLVFPGFTLPLVLNDSESALLRYFLRDRNVFGLICNDETGSGFFRYGVTLEVFESFVEKNHALHLKARARQRCKLLKDEEIIQVEGRIYQIRVQILAEHVVESPVANTQLLSLKMHRGVPTEDCKVRKYHLAQFTHSSWIYDRNELSYYVKLVTNRLQTFDIEENVPKDPILLSYWFVQNFQLTHRERLHILSLDDALSRLKIESKYLETERALCCALCKAEIARQSNVCAMSKDGLQSNYCNPSGHVYETITVTEAKNFTLQGYPSKQFSWFPGYAWSSMLCVECRSHLGWKFTSKNLHPKTFFGLAKIGLEIKILGNPTDCT